MTDELYVKLNVLVLAVAILAAPGSTRERDGAWVELIQAE